jgi:subtilisin family serine protease
VGIIKGGGKALLICALLISSSVFAAQYFQAGVDYAPNAIIVVFNQDISPVNSSVINGIVATDYEDINLLNNRFGVSYMWPMFPKAEEHGVPEMAGYYSLTFDDDNDLEEVLSAFEELRVASRVEAVAIHKVNFIPNDPLFMQQWGLSKINAQSAWNISHGDTSVVLGIPDTGVDWDHPDLNNDVWINEAEWNGSVGVDDDNNGYVDDYRGWDWVTGVNGWPGEDDQVQDNNPMDFDGHGTHVGGVAGSETNNSVGVASISFDCRIMALRIGWRAIDGNSYVRMDFASSAFYYAAIKGVNALNCSWGSSSGINSAANYARNQGVVIVTSAGNDNNTAAPYLASHSDVITVAATDYTDHKASFSNYGYWVDVCAPGVSIKSTYFNNTYADLDGTSMSAPFVTGLVGLVAAADPSLTREQIRAVIVDNADDIDALNPGYAGMLGTGRINAYNTLLAIGGIIDTPDPIYPIGSIYIGDPFPEFIWSASGSATVYHLKLGLSPLFTDPLINDSTITDTTYISTDSLDAVGYWYWTVRAGNGGTWSDFSAIEYFRLDITPPTNPVLISPADIWMTDQRPDFEWQASTDAGSGMDKYILQVDTEDDFSYPLALDDSTTGTFYTPAFDLASNFRYYWRVLARDNAGNIAYSGTGTFGIDNSPPDAPGNFEVIPGSWSSDPNFSINWTDPPDSAGIAMALYKIGDAPAGDYDTTGHFANSPGNVVASGPGLYPIFLWLEDNLGNVSYANSDVDTIFFDDSPPFGCEASSPGISSDFSFTVSWSAGEDTGSGLSGLYDVRYKDGEAGSWLDWISGYSGLDSVFTGENEHTYYFEARTYDLAGNQEPFSGIAESQTEVDTSYTGPSFIPGDANNSGEVNGLDVIFLVNYLKGLGPAPDPYLAGDANGSCSVNGLDITYLVAYLKGGNAPFAGNCD